MAMALVAEAAEQVAREGRRLAGKGKHFNKQSGSGMLLFNT